MLQFPRSVGVPALAGLLLALLSWLAPAAQAQRPVAPKLLPEHTLAYFRVLDTPQLISRFRETSIGRMGQDEQIKPLVSEFYAALQELWGNIEDRVGLPLDQVLSIPQGEICIAYVAMPEGGPSGLVVLIDVKDRLPSVKKLLEKGEAFASENRVTKTTEKLDGFDINIYAGPNGNNQAVQMERDGTIVITSGKPVMQLVLDGWAGKLEKTLADNDRFNTIMNRCQGTPDDPPQVTYYADPIQIVRTVARGSGFGTGLALLPVLGLDGIKGLGGSLIFSTGEFDDVTHFHLMLENPRSGIVEMLAMGAGDTTPEPWVPADVMGYSTLHWKLEDTYRNGAKLYNSLMSEGAAEAEIKQRVQDATGLDFESEILAAIDGRVTYVQWIEKPIKLNSQTNIIGIKLRDTKTFQPTLEKIVEKFKDNLEKKNFGGTTFYAIKFPQQPPRDDGQPATLRRPEPCVAIVGDYLILTDSARALEQCIITNSEPGKSLANELDYKLIASKIRRQVGGDSPGMVQFSRPETGMKLLYDLAQSQDTQSLLTRQAEGNQFFGRLEKAMKDNPLPPFSVIAKYFAPGGAMMVNDETGFHYTGFTLKRK